LRPLFLYFHLRFTICIISLYIKVWFNAPIATYSPWQDLEFLKNIYEYITINKEISKNICKNFVNYLWYLTSKNIALAFFDKYIPYDIKIKMAHNIKKVDLKI
jgi:hypothetical protein